MYIFAMYLFDYEYVKTIFWEFRKNHLMDKNNSEIAFFVTKHQD